MHRLQDKRLLKQQAYIDGHWCASEDGSTTSVTDPANGELIGRVPAMGTAEAARAVESAHRAFGVWRAMLPQERAAILRRWHDLMLENRDDLALLMTLEQGKPFREAVGEIGYAASFVAWFAEEGMRVYGETVVSHLRDRQLLVNREPVGVCALVTPWNFPSAMVTRKAAAALAAGCSVMVRPAGETPFSALALAELADRAGIPAGVFSVITGSPGPIVEAFMASPLVRALSFTGSTEIGQKLMAQGAATVKRCIMELGGHAPFLVFGDCDPDQAARGALAAKFQTGGQDCLAANRIYVHESLYERFLTSFTAGAAALALGHGLEAQTDIGPLMHGRAVSKCQSQVDDAVGKGARLLTGGGQPPQGGNFYLPTVLADVTPEMLIYREETFGPVAAVIPFRDEAGVIAEANDTEYGLAAYVFTRDLARAMRAAHALEYGMVAVNSVKMTGHPIPFGGVKQSGIGREGGHQGLEAFTELKYISLSMADEFVH